MSDEGESYLLDAAQDRNETAEAFQAKLARSSDAQVKYVGARGITVLQRLAMCHDWPELAAALVKRGCDVNAKDKFGWTALHEAGKRNHRETVRVLIEHGADPTIKNAIGKTAAEFAREEGHDEIAAYIDGAPALRAARGARRAPSPPSAAPPPLTATAHPASRLHAADVLGRRK